MSGIGSQLPTSKETVKQHSLQQQLLFFFTVESVKYECHR